MNKAFQVVLTCWKVSSDGLSSDSRVFWSRVMKRVRHRKVAWGCLQSESAGHSVHTKKKHATCYGQMDLYQVYLCISKLLHDRMQSVGLHGKEMLSCWWIFIKRLLRRSHLSLYVPQKTCGAAGFHVYIRCQILHVPSGKWQIYSLRPQCVLDLPVCEGLSLS